MGELGGVDARIPERMPLEQGLGEFFRATLGSVWTLEVLLLISDGVERSWSPAEIVAALRASDLIVSQALHDLTGAGLVVPEDDGRVRYGPVSPQLRDMVVQTRRLYERSPDKVRRMIVRARSTGLTAFADAFRIRKD